MKKILLVVGTRPNFIKITQFKKLALSHPSLDIKIVHTGQHYEKNLSEVFFNQFNLQPDFFLSIPSTTPNSQIANIMLELEKVVNHYQPDLLLVPGDVNSTLAAALTANKCNIKLAHLESGLRSFDKTMPEEHNRMATDALSDYFFVTEQSGADNLIREGKNPSNIFFVGNTMIDTLVAFDKEISQSEIVDRLSIERNNFVLMTMHRPSNVDTKAGIDKLLELCENASKQQPIVFPIHPRTIKNMEAMGVLTTFRSIQRLIITEPLDYFSFQKLVAHAQCIITDSGGVQEESTYRQIPCLTLRTNTERPVTTLLGTNELTPFNTAAILSKIEDIKRGKFKTGKIPPLWDGKASHRTMDIILKKLL
jgi:UDP-N-acetylglucosamine 2-epimerase (non-hydrolysing)